MVANTRSEALDGKSCRPRTYSFSLRQNRDCSLKKLFNTTSSSMLKLAQSNMNLRSKLAARFVLALPSVWAVLFLLLARSGSGRAGST